MELMIAALGGLGNDESRSALVGKNQKHRIG